MSEISGAMADRVRSYMSEVHLPLINMMQDTIETLKSNLILYTAWYYQIETDMLAEIPQDCIENQYAHLISDKDNYIEIADRIKQILNELDEYMDAGKFSSAPMTTLYDHAANNLLTLRDSVGGYEETHATYDLTVTTDMITYIRNIIAGQLGTPSDRISTYERGGIKDNVYFQKANALNTIQKSFITQVQEQVDGYQGAYIAKKADWDEELRQARENAITNLVVGGLAVVGGLTLIVVSGGAALPLVALYGAGAISTVTVVYGSSVMMEGQLGLNLVKNGDPRTIAYNPIRDTIFVNDPELYYKIGNMSMVACTMMLTMGMSMYAAALNDASILEAGAIEAGNLTISGLAGNFAGKQIEKISGSESLGLIGGTAVSLLTYGGIGKIAGKLSVSGRADVEGASGAGKWKNPDGSIKWPPNNGAVKGTEEIVTMKPGERFGRIGSPDGQYTAPPGTSPEKLSLAPGTDTSVYSEYEVIKEIPNVNKSEVAPWFDQPGGGIQNKMPQTIRQLERDGYIKKVK